METKDEYMKRIAAQFGENIGKMEEEYKQYLEYLKAARPNEKVSILEEKAFNLLKGQYNNLLINNQGQRYIGIVTEATATRDKNSYILDTIEKLHSNPAGLNAFLADQKVRITDDNKVYAKTKDGTKEYELVHRYQKQISGLFMDRDNQIKEFTCYWTQPTADDNPQPEVMFEPVEFRGKVSGMSQDGRVMINSVKATSFKKTSDPFPAFETLLMEKKLGIPVKMEKISSLPKNTSFFSLVEFSSVQGSEYGARGLIFAGDEQLNVRFPKGFDVHSVEGFALATPCILFGRYSPYNNKESGALIKQIEATGLYVMMKDRPVNILPLPPTLNTWLGDD